MAPFIISHLDMFDDIEVNKCVFWTFANIVEYCANDIGLNKDICASLIQSLDTSIQEVICPIIETIAHILVNIQCYS